LRIGGENAIDWRSNTSGVRLKVVVLVTLLIYHLANADTVQAAAHHALADLDVFE
jgi:hypothetical protein